MNRLVSWLLVPLVGGCGLIDAATSDHPNSRQADALGDIFTSIGAMAKVTTDPASATTGDLVDLHATSPHRRLLDPNHAPAERRAALELPAADRQLDGCFTRTEVSATWDCPFTLGAMSCTAKGSGMKNADGTVSGTSTQTCTGAPTVTVVATGVAFDKATGRGSGKISVDPETGWADVTIDGLGFCTSEANIRPNKGRVIVDGKGPLEGLPFDPITIRFTDDPTCGTALID